MACTRLAGGVLALLCGLSAALGAAPVPARAATCGAAGQPCTWNFEQAQVYAAQPPGRDGRGVTVAVVDSWVDASHPAFGGRVIDEADCVGGTCRDRRVTTDACEHGTHVAGTIGSSPYGVAPQVRLLAVRVLAYDPSSGECSGSAADVAAGIRFASAHGAQVVNLSLGGLVPGLFQSAAVTDAIHAAAQAGIVVVVAAGNSSLPLTDDYGGDALLVAATGPSGGLASYSDRGRSVALAAPGGDDGAGGFASCRSSTCIASTLPGNRYGLMEGTSMAAPHVAGAAALLIAERPTRGRVDVVHALESTARPLSGAGHGLLDAAAALRVDTPATTSVRVTETTPAGSASGPPSGGGPAASSPQPDGTVGSASPGALPASPSASRPVTAGAPPGTAGALSGTPGMQPAAEPSLPGSPHGAARPTGSSGGSPATPIAIAVAALLVAVGIGALVRSSRR